MAQAESPASPTAEAPTAGAPAPAAAASPAASPAGGAFARLATSRPRIRRDVLFTETPGGVLFHNADGGFHVAGRSAYRFASLLVPHFTGRHRLAEICAGFGPAQQAMAAGLVAKLYDRDFARGVPESDDSAPVADDETLDAALSTAFAAQIAYVDHYTDDARGRFRAFRETRVAVLGLDAVAHWCALSLLRNGCAALGLPAGAPVPAEVAAEAARLTAEGCPTTVDPLAADGGWAALEGYDVVVVTGPGGPARVHALLAEGVPEGRTLLPAWNFGRYAVTGPLSRAGATGCWSCALLRLGANVDAGTAAGLWAEVAAGTVPLAGAGTAAEGPLTAADPLAAMTGNLLGYEVFRLATGALPAETDRAVLLQDQESMDVTAEPVQPHPRCRHCAAPGRVGGEVRRPEALAVPPTATVATAREAEEVVEELNTLGDALVRPYTGVFSRYRDEEPSQTPLKLSRVELPLGDGRVRTLAAFDVHHLAGARLRALYAAAETYVSRAVPVPVEAGPPPAGVRAVQPGELTVGAAAGPVAAWTAAVSLTGGEPVRVPAAALQPYGPYNREGLVAAGGAGAGAGRSTAEAAGRGLLSALAHDALLRALRGEGAVRPLEPDDTDPEAAFLAKSAVNLGVEVELLDLGEAARSTAHVVLARERGGEGRWALGAELSRTTAACAALRDLLGQVQLAAEAPGEPVDLGDLPVADLAPAAVAVTAAADGGSKDTDWDGVLARLAECGRDVLYVETTPADLAAGGLRTARVLLTREPAATVTEAATEPGGGDER